MAPLTTQPSPLGRGWPATAFSPAVAGRVRGLFLPISDGTNPSPVILRLVKAPEADTLSPRERVDSRAWGTPAICRNEAGMSMKTKENANPALPLGERMSGGGAFTSRRWMGEGSLGSPRRDGNHDGPHVRTEGTKPECI
jgi:hypothetical protein